MFYNAEDYLAVAPNAIIAQVENVWLQVDPVLDRYKAAAESGNGDTQNTSFLHEVLASTEAGVLQVGTFARAREGSFSEKEEIATQTSF